MNKEKYYKKTAAVFLVALVCTTIHTGSVLADGPSGPSGDASIALYDRWAATGPGAVQDNKAAEAQAAAAQAAAEAQAAAAQAQAAAEAQAAAAQAQAAAEAQAAAAQAQAAAEAQAAAKAQAADVAAQENESTDGKVFSNGRWLDPNKPMIALTFDDGPYAPVGNQIMDVMEQHNGRATFYVVGNRVASYKTEIKRMHDNGHEIGNHSYSHKIFTKLNASEIRSEVEKCNQAVAAVTGVAPKTFRLPGGAQNNTVMANMSQPVILWNVDTLDWKTRNVQKTYDAVVGKVKDGDIVLMHEIHKPSGEAAVRMIPILADQGFQLVTVSELAHFRGGMKAGKSYSSFHHK